MKKQLILVSSIALAFTLSACSDATATISDGSEALVTVGKEKISKGDIYDSLKSNAGRATLLQLQKELYKKEDIEVTDEMQKQADEKLAAIKKEYGDSYEEKLKSNGYADEQAVMDELIMPSIYQLELQKKYVTEKKDTLFQNLHPVKAQIFQASDEDKAKSALKALKDGKDIKDVIKEYGVSTTYDGTEAVYVSGGSLPTDVFTALTGASKTGLIDKVITVTSSSSTSTYYIAVLTNNDPAKYEEDAIQAIAETSSIATEATKFFFEKYDMTIYDIDAYNAMSDYIVQ